LFFLQKNRGCCILNISVHFATAPGNELKYLLQSGSLSAGSAVVTLQLCITGDPAAGIICLLRCGIEFPVQFVMDSFDVFVLGCIISNTLKKPDKKDTDS